MTTSPAEPVGDPDVFPDDPQAPDVVPSTDPDGPPEIPDPPDPEPSGV